MADVAADLKSWSTTAASNAPSGATAVGAGLDDNLREIQKVVRQDLATKGADIASAATTDLGAVAGVMHDITGTTAITSFGTVSAGIWKIIKFEGALTLTHNATSLILPGAANITTADGDTAIVISEGSGNWRCVDYQKASAAPVTLSPITNSLGSDVALNNTSTYFDGPSVAQGTSGTWYASGTVVLTDGNGAANFSVKLWDGTTVMASLRAQSSATGSAPMTVAISGYISNPAANIRISVKDETSIGGTIRFNSSGNSKDSTITAFRIG